MNIPSHKGKPAQVSNRAQGLEADFDSIPLNWTFNPPGPGSGELKKKESQYRILVITADESHYRFGMKSSVQSDEQFTN